MNTKKRVKEKAKQGTPKGPSSNGGPDDSPKAPASNEGGSRKEGDSVTSSELSGEKTESGLPSTQAAGSHSPAPLDRRHKCLG